MRFKKKRRLDDQEILKGILAGGAEAEKICADLYDLYSGLVIHGMKRYGLEKEDALDVYADAIIALRLQVIHQKFRGESSIKTYLFRIFYNRCSNKARDLKTKQLSLIDELPDYPEQGQSILNKLIVDEAFQALGQLLDQIGKQCKDIILLRDYYGYSPDEIAEKIGFKTPRSVSSMRVRCRAKLKALIAQNKQLATSIGKE